MCVCLTSGPPVGSVRQALTLSSRSPEFGNRIPRLNICWLPFQVKICNEPPTCEIVCADTPSSSARPRDETTSPKSLPCPGNPPPIKANLQPARHNGWEKLTGGQNLGAYCVRRIPLKSVIGDPVGVMSLAVCSHSQVSGKCCWGRGCTLRGIVRCHLRGGISVDNLR
jgi:hypothetical protein